MIGYLIKSGVLLTVFYAFFILFMRLTTFFRFNRIMLLLGTAICMLIPITNINFSEIANGMPHIVLPEVAVENNTVDSSSFIFSWKTACILIYLLGVITISILMIKSLLKTTAVIRQGALKRESDYILRIIEEDIPSFSFLRTIVISKNDYEEHPVILKHEIAHINNCHTNDLLLFSVVTLIYWFNPLVWMARSELMMLHEYEADDSVIQQGIDATQYQLLLVKKAVGTQRFQLANGFNHTKLKNRITMMQKNKSHKLAKLAYIACLPVLLGTLCFCSGNNSGKEKHIDGETAAICCDIDTAPTFNGGGSDAFAEWVNSNLVYPQTCKDNRIEGKVLAKFVIDESGNLIDAKITESVCKEIDEEVLRVLNSSPKWTPATAKGKNVRVELLFPVEFLLR